MALTVFSINEVKSRRMRWVVIFSIQFLLDFSFARRDSWVAESGMITSSGLTTCEKGNIGVPWLKHCNWACWRASVYNMFPTSSVSTLSVLWMTDPPGTCASLQPCFCSGVSGMLMPAAIAVEESEGVVWSILFVLVWMQCLVSRSNMLHWTDRYLSCCLPTVWSVGRCWSWFVGGDYLYWPLQCEW